MRITVKIGDIEVTIDRPKMDDYTIGAAGNDGPKWRTSLLETAVLPMLTEATNKAKELFNLRNQ